MSRKTEEFKQIITLCKINRLEINISMIENSLSRALAYRALGWTKEALKDPDEFIRRDAYDALGWTEEAYDDDSSVVRNKAYHALGWPAKALMESDEDIRKDAALWFELKKLSRAEAKSMVAVWKLEQL